ncbi:hypothetical protein [Cupriavidus plantarum]|uniref:Secreted protein n=1 Tax=Cupriavidus plantarum TaxID=942865 RepID=A0A316F9F4_9BURK|nr:hypothetical protein [Cupriavidus plantarum]NYI01718.1 type II secretory pathway pseudopilin PulG [Cupriavidus plantarum]PWK33854.1 hypothetical protein C7419_103173 [Cupriavidus plantarum]REE91031.1 hypothetical protein C7418_4330 [Cupriavidus plantarum]RLK33704.1 hypothetical protein C7417_4354 [Cupriavidus plantarum]CAG2148068.1 hypothetical protein LMG26296_04251 [Cupriavidus plantarum]
MKRVLLALAGTAALVSSVSAFAGPDWTVIERARAYAHQQQVQQVQLQHELQEARKASGSDNKAG